MAVLSRRPSERLTGVAYRLGWTLICRVPQSWASWAFAKAADIAWRRQGPGVQVLEANLRRVLSWKHGTDEVDGKELRTLSRAALHSYARYYLEAFRLPVIPAERLVSGMHFQGPNEATLFANLKAGRGVIIALPHMGNFEQAGAWVIGRGAGKFTTVAERLRPESVYESFLRFRQSLGMEVLPLTGGGSPFGILAQRLRAGSLVCLVSDRDLKESGVEVDFFGEKARISAVAALAVHTGAALMPTATLVRRRGLGRAHLRRDPGAGDRHPRREGRRDDPGDGRPVHRGDRRAPAGLAHAAEGLHRRPRPGSVCRRHGVPVAPGSES